MIETIEQLRAAVYGQAVGDALGVPYEFQDRDSFACANMIGHGTHNQPAGTWSDDTSMMLATLDSLIGNDWQVDIEDMQHRFNAWLYDGEYAIDGNVFDCGNTVREALHRGHGLHGEWDNGNGSLMRIMPLAFTDAGRETVGEVSAITHAHRLSQECCWAWVQLLRSALHGNGLGRLGSYAKGYGRDSVKSGGYVKDTFNAAIWCVANTSNYRDCVLAAADSDGRFMDLPKDRLKAIDREIRKRQKAQARRAGNAGYSSEREYAKSGKTSRAYRRTRLEIGRLHAKSKRILDDVYQKYTTRLVRENDLIVLENLRLANMSRRNKPVPDPLHEGRYLPNGQDAKRGLNRSLRRASMGRLASILAYKTKLADGVGMILVNPAYTSQTCSRCGHVDKKNRESQAVFVCKKCSYTANADMNAARNILERGLDTLAVTSENLWGADGTPVEQGHKTNGNAARESVAVS